MERGFVKAYETAWNAPEWVVRDHLAFETREVFEFFGKSANLVVIEIQRFEGDQIGE